MLPWWTEEEEMGSMRQKGVVQEEGERWRGERRWVRQKGVVVEEEEEEGERMWQRWKVQTF